MYDLARGHLWGWGWYVPTAALPWDVGTCWFRGSWLDDLCRRGWEGSAGYWAVLVGLEPWDPVLGLHQGGRPPVTSGTLTLWPWAPHLTLVSIFPSHFYASNKYFAFRNINYWKTNLEPNALIVMKLCMQTVFNNRAASYCVNINCSSQLCHSVALQHRKITENQSLL